ncbi:MAG: sigma-70 family RNA polymerase sigma factor [Polyangiaceae bacterium]
MSHEALTSAAASGDDLALEALVRLHHDRVYRFGRRVCRDDFDADDAVQEAFAKLAVRPDVIADQGALSWLMSVVRNACLRLLRPFQRERRALGERTDEEPATELSPEAALARWELVRAVHAAIATLDKPYREVLVLRDLEGLTGEETAAALGVELAAMKSRLHRARAMLRERLPTSK